MTKIKNSCVYHCLLVSLSESFACNLICLLIAVLFQCVQDFTFVLDQHKEILDRCCHSVTTSYNYS